MSSSGGGGPIIPEWIYELRGLAFRIESRGLLGAIVSLVLGTFVSIFILQPLRYGIDFLEWAGAMIDGSFVVLREQVAGAFKPVEEAIIGSNGSQGVTDIVFGGLESGLMDAGLGAPLASTLTVVVLASILTVLVYALIRVGIDAIPGAGGLIR